MRMPGKFPRPWHSSEMFSGGLHRLPEGGSMTDP